MNFLQFNLWENTGERYALALGVFLFTIIISYLFKKIILANLRRASKKTKIDADDFLISIIEHIRPPFYFFIALYIASRFLILPRIVSQTIFVVFLVVVILEVILALQRTIDFVIRKKFIKKGDENKDKEAIIKLIGSITKIVIWVLGILMVFSNLGVNITSLIAGLGIGGIAIALAVQNILGDMFASFSIFIDKPFNVGDFIIVGDDMGTVRKIGIKSTRVTTLEGQELVIPNKDLMEERINNYGRMKKRRVVFSLGVTYSTNPESLKRIPEIIKNIIENQKDVEFGRSHFKKYGESSLDFEVVYFINSADYDRYMDTQQEINLEIFERFNSEGIEFAFPSRTVYLEK